MRRVTINGRRWNFTYANLRTKDGDCDDPAVNGKTIRISRHLLKYPAALMEAILHEGLHAGLPDLSEQSVETLGRDLARLLHNEGFTR
jgi:hypothetical protein